jgi:uncharacterized RDD family membrane protein YckC
VIRICSKCGALLLNDDENCSFCAVAAAQNHLEDKESPQFVAAGGASHRIDVETGVDDNAEPEWRTEVSRRLEQYRTRRGRVLPEVDPGQSGLPFREERAKTSRRRAIVEDDASQEPVAVSVAPRERRPERERWRHTERVEISVQPELDFAAAAHERSRPQTAMVPVVTISERLWAAGIDAVFLGLTCGGFAALFRSLGGQIAVSKMDALVCAAVLYLFYALYLCLFIPLAGATPGMQLRGLSIVRLDGTLPDTPHLLWRSFGYLLSGATGGFGFLWALWDEDRFTWQDRISQTYVTAVEPLPDGDSFDLSGADVPIGRRTFAHK